ncbi:hypothetical protein ALNOE001_19720 [Candidatus Methanobinarius endosymbioticus]|uniref:Uncharacterized protein n=1 Tax=Candidatus Methanobinarius endosymbioticus TaxID=2006182 RepID=A0A366M7N4_9EURY|nr:hypothetical protein ALNOE001_19720 [Candidatus Methanobinarius endosymbioticus]
MGKNDGIINFSFVCNIAELNAGAIFNPQYENNTLSINDSNFTSNKPKEGSVIVTLNILSFNNNIFMYNVATEAYSSI